MRVILAMSVARIVKGNAKTVVFWYVSAKTNVKFGSAAVCLGRLTFSAVKYFFDSGQNLDVL